MSQVATAFATFVVVAVLAVGPMIGGSLGAIDDHEIPLVLSENGGSLELSEIPGAIAHHATESDRFRPFYWTIRVVEVGVWGLHATGWYIDRVLLLVATLASSFALARRFAGRALSFLAALLVVSGPQLEAWYRLGPQEAIAVPLLVGGLALAAWRLSAAAILLLVLAALTKEAFVPFALAGLGLIWTQGHSRLPLLLAGAVVVTAGLVAVVLALPSGGQYGLSRDAPAVLATLAWQLTPPAMWLLPIALIAAARSGYGRAAAVGLGLIFFSAITYAGMTDQARYLLPSAIVGAIAATWMLSRLPRWSTPLAALLIVGIVSNLATERARATAWAQWSQSWEIGVADIRAVLGPTDTLVIATGHFWEWEDAVALTRYTNATRAVLIAPPPTDDVGLPRSVRLGMENIARNGGQGFVPGPADEPCVLAVLFEATEADICERTVAIDNGRWASPR